MSKEPRGLGKGLSALLGEAATTADRLRTPIGYVNKEIVGTGRTQDSQDVLRVPVEMIEANPFQPRLSFDQEALDELTASIRMLGLIQPITVRRISDTRYQIISGERRFKACCKAGMTTIPAYVRDANDQGMLEMALVENIQRENLDPMETALSYQRLIDECQLTQDVMADRVGKKRSSVANMLRLLKLPAKVQHDLKVGLISVGHAKVILGVEDADAQERLCDMVISEGLNIRQLENIVRRIHSGEKVQSLGKNSSLKELPQQYASVRECLARYFGDKVSVRRNDSGKGSITLRFSSDGEVDRFLEALKSISSE